MSIFLDLISIKGEEETNHKNNKILNLIINESYILIIYKINNI